MDRNKENKHFHRPYMLPSSWLFRHGRMGIESLKQGSSLNFEVANHSSSFFLLLAYSFDGGLANLKFSCDLRPNYKTC